MTQIASKIHEGLAMYGEAKLPLPDDLDLATIFPPFVINRRVATDFDVAAALKTVTALATMDRAHLPWPVTTLEFWEGSAWRECFYMIEGDTPNQFTMVHWGFGIVPEGHPNAGTRALKHPEKFAIAFGDEGKWKSQGGGGLVKKGLQALLLALIMPHLSQLERYEVNPAKLNKARQRSGKSIISPHTIIRLGYVYDREGRKVPLTETNRTMPIHLRAGHIRNQPHGDIYRAAHPEAEGDHHQVFIPPTLVNYHDGDEVPAPKPRIVRP